jgi:hypothetical protein
MWEIEDGVAFHHVFECRRQNRATYAPLRIFNVLTANRPERIFTSLTGQELTPPAGARRVAVGVAAPHDLSRGANIGFLEGRLRDTEI